MKHAPGFLAAVERVRHKVKEVSVAEVAAKRARHEDFVLIDVREDDEWRSGHIPDAIHIGRGVLERDVEAKLPDPTRVLVLYCGGGYRSALAADALQQMGYVNVLSMAGGMRAWRDAGHAETRD